MSRMLKFLLALITLLAANLASAATSNPTKSLRLNKVDPRAFSDVTVAVSYYVAGQQYYDYEVIGSWNKLYSLEIRQAAGTLGSDGVYFGDFLHTTSSGATCTSNCKIFIEKTDTRTMTNVMVHISFVINGYMHFDAEVVGMPGAPAFTFGEDFLEDLNVDARNATWDGNTFRGNLLKAPAQVSSFYWDFNQTGYNSEIWVEGITPNITARLMYVSPVFPEKFLYYVNIDANGIGHGVFSTHFCDQIKMRQVDIYSPQQLRLIDNSGNTLLSFASNSLRACNYSP